MYIAVQMVGSIIASLVVMDVLGKSGNVGLTLPIDSDHWYHAFVLEVVLMFLLMLVCISMKEDKVTGYKNFGGLAVGATIVLADIIGMNISGASMNPARSFGPAIVFGNLNYNWIYWIAPIIGSLIAIYSFKIVKSDPFYKQSKEVKIR